MSRRGFEVEYVRVADRWVRLERPMPLPQYDAYDLMGAAFFGTMVGMFMVALLVVGK